MKANKTYNQLTTEEFIVKARALHGEKYDYSRVIYTNGRTKVRIICPLHGEFWQKPEVHLMGCGCRKCGAETGLKKITISKEEFIRRSIEVHGMLDDYSMMNYVNTHTKVLIITPEYGEIYITPKDYLRWKRNPPKRELTFDYCKEIIKKYNYDLNLINKHASSVRSAIVTHGWGDLEAMINRRWHMPWTDVTCEEESRKYTSKKEFERGSNGAYNYAVRNGLINGYTWLTTPIRKGRDPRLKEYCIYAYEDEDNKTAYIGLTIDLKRRDRQHRNGRSRKGVREYDTVAKYYMSEKKEMPSPVVLIEGINQIEAQYYEDVYKNKYVYAGWTILNKGNTGVNLSSLGGSVIKWNYDGCFAEATKYDTLRDFIERSQPAYSVAKKQDWIKDYTWFKSYKRRTKWSTYEAVKQESLKYSTRIEFKLKNVGAYNSSRNNLTKDGIRWIDTFVWLKDTSTVLSEAHKGKKCKNLAHFHSKESREKARLSNTGKKRTDKQKQRMRDAARKRSVFQIDIKSGMVIREFDSAKSAAESFGKPRGASISSCCCGKRKTAYGFRWQYVD